MMDDFTLSGRENDIVATLWNNTRQHAWDNGRLRGRTCLLALDVIESVGASRLRCHAKAQSPGLDLQLRAELINLNCSLQKQLALGCHHHIVSKARVSVCVRVGEVVPL